MRLAAVAPERLRSCRERRELDLIRSAVRRGASTWSPSSPMRPGARAADRAAPPRCRVRVHPLGGRRRRASRRSGPRRGVEAVIEAWGHWLEPFSSYRTQGRGAFAIEGGAADRRSRVRRHPHRRRRARGGSGFGVAPPRRQGVALGGVAPRGGRQGRLRALGVQGFVRAVAQVVLAGRGRRLVRAVVVRIGRLLLGDVVLGRCSPRAPASPPPARSRRPWRCRRARGRSPRPCRCRRWRRPRAGTCTSRCPTPFVRDAVGLAGAVGPGEPHRQGHVRAEARRAERVGVGGRARRRRERRRRVRGAGWRRPGSRAFA